MVVNADVFQAELGGTDAVIDAAPFMCWQVVDDTELPVLFWNSAHAWTLYIGKWGVIEGAGRLPVSAGLEEMCWHFFLVGMRTG